MNEYYIYLITISTALFFYVLIYKSISKSIEKRVKSRLDELEEASKDENKYRELKEKDNLRLKKSEKLNSISSIFAFLSYCIFIIVGLMGTYFLFNELFNNYENFDLLNDGGMYISSPLILAYTIYHIINYRIRNKT